MFEDSIIKLTKHYMKSGGGVMEEVNLIKIHCKHICKYQNDTVQLIKSFSTCSNYTVHMYGINTMNPQCVINVVIQNIVKIIFKRKKHS
jgi:hypothetical protein